jgi:hypothetical protein
VLQHKPSTDIHVGKSTPRLKYQFFATTSKDTSGYNQAMFRIQSIYTKTIPLPGFPGFNKSGYSAFFIQSIFQFDFVVME